VPGDKSASSGEAAPDGKIASDDNAVPRGNAAREPAAKTVPKLTASKLTALKLMAPKLAASKLAASKLTAPKLMAPKLMTKVMEAIEVLHHQGRGEAVEPGLRRPIPSWSGAPISEIAPSAKIIRGTTDGGLWWHGKRLRR
jgi:hypothetical protein